MAFESQNKLVSSFNTDNVKQGLFRYKGNTSVSNIRGVSSGFVNTVSLQTNAGDIYREANEALQAVAKTATHIKTVQNQEDELRQSIDMGKNFSERYQKFILDKEKANTPEAKQAVTDKFKADVEEYSGQLTDQNKKALFSSLHNVLSFEVRSQAALIKQDNKKELETTMNNQSLVLLSQAPEERMNTINSLRKTYNELGFSNDEFNDIAFSSLANNLFAGVNSNNISREALYAIENTVNGLLNDFGELEGSRAYNATIDKINSLKSALTNRDKSYVNRAIQLNDAENFNIYNEALHKNGEITDVEYEQNILAFNMNGNRLARTPENMLNEIRATLGNGIDSISLESLKKNIPSEYYNALETERLTNAINLISQEVVDIKRLNDMYKLDPNIVENAFSDVVNKTLINVNSSIGALQDVKDLNSEEAQQHFGFISALTGKFKQLTDNTTFVSISATADKNNKDILDMIDIHSIVNNGNLSFNDRAKMLYRKINGFDATTSIDTKVFNKTYKNVSDKIIDEVGRDYSDIVSKHLSQYIEAGLLNGLEPSVIEKNASNIFKPKKFQSKFFVDDEVSRTIGAIAYEDADLVPSFFSSSKYDELLYTKLENDLSTLLNNGSLSIDEYTVKQQELAGNIQRDLAIFKETYNNMRNSGEKLLMYFDRDLNTYVISDNKGETLRVPIPDMILFRDIFNNYRSNTNSTLEKIKSPDYVELQLL